MFYGRRADGSTRNDDGAVSASAALLGTVTREPKRMATFETRSLGDCKAEGKNTLAAVTGELKATLRKSIIVDGRLDRVLLGEEFGTRSEIRNRLRRKKRRSRRLRGSGRMLIICY